MKKLINDPYFLKQLYDSFQYEPETGKVTVTKEYFNRTTSSPNLVVGSTVPTTNMGGYPVITFKGKRIALHLLCWFLATRKYPTIPIDHIDHNTQNTKWANLRKVTTADNNKNASLRKDTSSGIQGVYWNERKKRYIATIRATQIMFKGGELVKQTVRWEKSFTSDITAKLARERKLKELGFHENHGKPNNL